MPARTQEDLVKEKLSKQEKVITDRLTPPAIRDLHTKSLEDIATTLAQVLKSRPNIRKLTYVVGESIDITYEKAY